MTKTNRRYKVSKIVYVGLLEFSLIEDIVFALSFYEAIKGILGNLVVLAGVSFLLASILGISLYLIYMWQVEQLTKSK